MQGRRGAGESGAEPWARCYAVDPALRYVTCQIAPAGKLHMITADLDATYTALCLAQFSLGRLFARNPSSPRLLTTVTA